MAKIKPLFGIQLDNAKEERDLWLKLPKNFRQVVMQWMGLLHIQNVTTSRLFLYTFSIRRNGETEERGKHTSAELQRKGWGGKK